MMPSDDNSELIYAQSREADVQAEQDEIVDQDLQEQLMSFEPNSVSREPEVSEEPASEPAADDDVSTTADVGKAIARGPVLETADFVDNLNSLNDELGLPKSGLSRLLTDDETGEQITLREFLEKHLGTPETTAGEIAQVISGQLALILPGMAAVKGTSLLAKFLKFIVVPAVVAGATTAEGEENLANIAITAGEGNSAFDNFFTRALANDTDDATFERMLKTAVIDLPLGIAGEGVGRGIGAGLRALRGKRVAASVIADAAERSGAEIDEVLSDAASDVVITRTQSTFLDDALAQLDELKKTADEAAFDLQETAAFRGETPDAPLDLLDPVINDLRQKATAARQSFEQAEAHLTSLAGDTTADGRVLEATRQLLNEGDTPLGKEANEALGNAATRNLPVRPATPARVLFNNFLEVDEDVATQMAQDAINGNLHDFTAGAAAVLDSKNYDRLVGDDGLKNLMSMIAQATGGGAKSTRRKAVEKLGQSLKNAEENLADMAAETGTTPEQVVNAVMEALPDQGLTKAVQTARLVDNMLTKKVELLAAEMRDPLKTTPLDYAEFSRWLVMASNMSDRLAGAASSVGRASSSMRIDINTGQFDDLLISGKAARGQQLENIINSAGGRTKLDKIAEMIRMAGDTDTARKIARQHVSNHTIGDTLYNAFIMNILSSPVTQAINIASNTWRVAIWNPGIRTFEAGAIAIIEGDPTAFKEVSAYVTASWGAARSGLVLNGAFSAARKGGLGITHSAARAISLSPVGRAAARGSKNIGTQTVQFIEDAPTSLLRTRALSSLIRRGVPLTKIPGFELPLFPAPKRVRDFLADSLIERKGPPVLSLGAKALGLTRTADFLNKRAGVGPRMIDFVGRVMEYSGKMLAAGDQLAAGMNYAGQLAADSVAHVRTMGLEGDDFLRMVDQLRRDVPNVKKLAENAMPFGGQQEQYVTVLERLEKAAVDSADRGTYTTPAGERLAQVMRMRRVIPGVRWILPFIRTPANLIKSGIRDFTPAGPVVDLVRLQGSGNKTEQARAVGRLVATMGFVGGVLAAVDKGMITGGGPHNFRERERWLGAGNVPYSIKIPGIEKAIRYNRLDPIAMPMGILADLMDLAGKMDEEEHEFLYKEFLGKFQELIDSKSYLESISTIVHLYEDPARYGRRLIVSTVENTIVPGSRFFASIDRGGMPIPDDLVDKFTGKGEPSTGLLEDFVRGDKTRPLIQDEGDFNAEGLFLQLGSSIQADLPPGLSEGFTVLWQKVISAKLNEGQTPSRNYFAEIRTLPPSIGPDLASPFIGSDISTDDPLNNELARIKFQVSLNGQFGQINGVKLTPKQQDRFQILFATPKNKTSLRDKYISKIFKSDGKTLKASWVEKGDTFGGVAGGKVDKLNKIEERYYSKAVRNLRKEFPELDKALTLIKEENKLRKKQAGVEELKRRRGLTPLSNALDGNR